MLQPLRRLSPMEFHASFWPFAFSDGLLRFSVAPPFGVIEFHTFVWPLQLGSWTPTLCSGCLRLGDGLPRFVAPPQAGLMGPMPLRGLLSYGDELPFIGVAS